MLILLCSQARSCKSITARDSWLVERLTLTVGCAGPQTDGSLSFTLALKGPECTKVNWLRQKNRGNDVWVFDTGYQIWVWIGAAADGMEKLNGMK